MNLLLLRPIMYKYDLHRITLTSNQHTNVNLVVSIVATKFNEGAS